MTIPSSVKSVGDFAFFNCTAMNNVYYCGSLSEKNMISIGAYNETLINATWKCDFCSHSQTLTKTENEVKSTCVTDGSYDSVIYCSVSDTELSRESKTIDKLGHNYIENAVAPTCAEQGYTAHTCANCGGKYKTYGYEVCVVDITLNLSTPCRRRLCIPMDTTLDVFHRIIGALFEWEEYHYYNFILKATQRGIPLIIASPNPDEDMAFSFERIKAYDDSEVTLADVFSQIKKFYYEYDFGDG